MPKISNFRSTRLLGAALTLILTVLVAGLAFAAPPLKRVETKKVCMVNNQVFEKDQIPVQVENRTYYGCCEMCKERLAKDPASRQAVDPVTGKTVDKSKAVIGALPDGKVLYFESEETFGKYEAPTP